MKQELTTVGRRKSTLQGKVFGYVTQQVEALEKVVGKGIQKDPSLWVSMLKGIINNEPASEMKYRKPLIFKVTNALTRLPVENIELEYWDKLERKAYEMKFKGKYGINGRLTWFAFSSVEEIARKKYKERERWEVDPESSVQRETEPQAEQVHKKPVQIALPF